MRMPGFYLRTSFARWGFVPLTVFGLLVLFQRNSFWIGIWPESGAAVAVSAFFFSMFAAGLSAWVSGRLSSYGSRAHARAGVHRQGLQESFSFAANLAWIVLAYSVQVVIAAVLTVKEGAPGGASYVGYVLLGLTLIVMSAAWGWSFGAFMNPAFAAAAAFFSWFIFLSVAGPLFDADVNSGPAWISVDIAAIVLRMVIVAVFCAAVIVSVSDGVMGSRLAKPGTIALASLSLSAMIVAPAPLGHRTASEAPLCIDRIVTYCLWPEHQKFASVIEDTDAELAGLPSVLVLPDRMVEYSLSGSRVWDENGNSREVEGVFDPEFSIPEGSQRAFARSLALAIVSETFAECDVMAPEDPELGSEQLWAWVEYRLAGGDVDYTTDAPGALQEAWSKGIEAGRTLNDADQATWAADIVRETRAEYCHVL